MTKNLKLKNITAAIGIVLGLCITPLLSQAQEYEPWTGAISGTTFDLGNGTNLKNIRRLLNEGKTEAAVRVSKKTLAALENGFRTGHVSESFYDAYNALCISLTANGEYEEAMDACNSAIKQYPSRWMALNSRGSLNFKSGKFDAALSDYQKALKGAPNTTLITRVLEHNVEISQAKIASNR